MASGPDLPTGWRDAPEPGIEILAGLVDLAAARPDINPAALIERWDDPELRQHLAATLALSAIAFYVFVYTMWLKRTTAQNIVIGGAAGAVPAHVGWAAVTGTVGLPAWVLFAIVFVWSPPHFWALAMRYSGDYAAAGVPMLPVVRGEHETRRQILLYSRALFATTLLLVPIAGMGPVSAATAVVLGGVFVWRALRLWRDGSPTESMRLFRFSIVYLGLLFLAVAIDAVMPSAIG